MQEYKVKFNNREYVLNNNSGKYDRVFDSKFNPEFVKGEPLTNEQILAYYDKFAGLILDENRQKIESGQFWKLYEAKLVTQNQREKSWNKKKKIASSFVEFIRGVKEVSWFVVVIIFLIAVFLGYDRIVSVIKDIKGLF